VRHNDEVKEARRNSGKGGVTPSKPKGRLVNFSPTEEHKRQLQSGILDLTKSVEVLESFAEDGHRISLGGSVDKGGFFAIVRESGEDWRNAESVAFWASTLERAVVLAGFYLREVNPEFPLGVRPTAITDDW